MMDVDVRMMDLSGIGTRYEIGCADGGRVAVVIHKDGYRDIYSFDPGAEAPSSALRVSDTQSRALAAILLGAYLEPTVEEDTTTGVGDLAMEWLDVTAGSSAEGETLGRLDLAGQTGLPAAALVRRGESTPAPGDDVALEAGDRLVFVGNPHQIDAARRILQEG